MTNREIVDNNQQIKNFLDKQKLRDAFVFSVVVGLFMGFLSPFGMDEEPMLRSMFYWVLTCLSGYFVYMPMLVVANSLLVKLIPAYWCRIVLSVFTASIIMSFIIPVITWLVFSTEINFSVQLPEVFPKVLVIGGVLTCISLLQEYFTWQKTELATQRQLNKTQQDQAIKASNQEIDSFMALLPIDKRGELICLEMADHYVKVYTDKGHHLLLMRFKDALEKLEKYSGIQTHRSWWVAFHALMRKM